MVDRNIEIWKGQALNIAKDEQFHCNPTTKLHGLDLDLLFKRAKQIFYKAFEHDFFEWKPKKESKEKQKEKVNPEWVECQKCHKMADKANYDYCRCGESIPK